MLVALGAFVTLLYTRTEQLEYHYQQLIQNESPARHDVVDSRKLGKRSADPHEENEIDETKLDQSKRRTDEDEIGRKDEGQYKPEDRPAIHVTGNSLYQTLVKAEGFHVINNWSASPSADSNFNLEEGSAIEVLKGGTYLIYAQLSWRMKRGLARFSINKLHGEEARDVVDEDTLASCVTHFSEKYALLESCYTSVAVELEAGDRVHLVVENNDLTLDFPNGKSFFGAILLN